MRIALISAITAASDAPDQLTAGQSLLGRSILDRQVDTALNLGAERIICLTRNANPLIIAAQHRAEENGARFYTISRKDALSGLINAADDVLVFADGVLLSELDIPDALKTKRAILTVPSDPGLAAGFERIDAQNVWAGLLITPGSTIEKLAELPDDFDPQSALLRLSLQAGVASIAVPADLVREGRWSIGIAPDAADALEARVIAAALPKASPFAPGKLAARLFAKMLGRIAMTKPLAGALVIAGIAIFVITSLVAGYVSGAVTAFAFAGIAAILRDILDNFERISTAANGTSPRSLTPALGWLVDGALVAALALPWALPASWPGAAFGAALILTLRLAEKNGPAWVKQSVSDRTALSILLLIAAIFQGDMAVSAVISVGILAILLFLGKSGNADLG